MRGEYDRRLRLLGRRGVDVEAIAFDVNPLRLVTDAAKFSIEIVSDGSFIARDGFDIDQLASERDCVHGKSINYLELRAIRREP